MKGSKVEITQRKWRLSRNRVMHTHEHFFTSMLNKSSTSSDSLISSQFCFVGCDGSHATWIKHVNSISRESDLFLLMFPTNDLPSSCAQRKTQRKVNDVPQLAFEAPAPASAYRPLSGNPSGALDSESKLLTESQAPQLIVY